MHLDSPQLDQILPGLLYGHTHVQITEHGHGCFYLGWYWLHLVTSPSIKAWPWYFRAWPYAYPTMEGGLKCSYIFMLQLSAHECTKKQMTYHVCSIGNHCSMQSVRPDNKTHRWFASPARLCYCIIWVLNHWTHRLGFCLSYSLVRQITFFVPHMHWLMS